MHSGQKERVLTLQNTGSSSLCSPKGRHSPGCTQEAPAVAHAAPFSIRICQQEKSQRVLSQLRTSLLFLGTRFPCRAGFLVICC